MRWDSDGCVNPKDPKTSGCHCNCQEQLNNAYCYFFLTNTWTNPKFRLEG